MRSSTFENLGHDHPVIFRYALTRLGSNRSLYDEIRSGQLMMLHKCQPRHRTIDTSTQQDYPCSGRCAKDQACEYVLTIRGTPPNYKRTRYPRLVGASVWPVFLFLGLSQALCMSWQLQLEVGCVIALAHQLRGRTLVRYEPAHSMVLTTAMTTHQLA